VSGCLFGLLKHFLAKWPGWLDRVHSDDRGGTQIAGEIKGQQLGLENIEISSLVPDPVTRDINLVEVSYGTFLQKPQFWQLQYQQ
jgi:hypothetical protein